MRPLPAVMTTFTKSPMVCRLWCTEDWDKSIVRLSRHGVTVPLPSDAAETYAGVNVERKEPIETPARYRTYETSSWCSSGSSITSSTYDLADPYRNGFQHEINNSTFFHFSSSRVNERQGILCRSREDAHERSCPQTRKG